MADLLGLLGEPQRSLSSAQPIGNRRRFRQCRTRVSTVVTSQSGTRSCSTLSMSTTSFVLPTMYRNTANPTDTSIAAIGLRVNTATSVETAYRMANVNVSTGTTTRNDGSQYPDRTASASHTSRYCRAR